MPEHFVIHVLIVVQPMILVEILVVLYLMINVIDLIFLMILIVELEPINKKKIKISERLQCVHI